MAPRSPRKRCDSIADGTAMAMDMLAAMSETTSAQSSVNSALQAADKNSSHPSHNFNNYDAQPNDGGELPDVPTQFTQVNSLSRSIPDLTQERMHNTPELVSLVNEYRSSYADASITDADRMARARAMAMPMLQHYFPEAQGFRVIPHTFNRMAKDGWLMEKKALKNGVTTYHAIPAENIAGFCVQLMYGGVDLGHGVIGDKWFPHFYLGIIIDDLSTYNEWASYKTSLNFRSDVLAYSYGTVAEIDVGHGIMIVGDHIEFYKFERKKENKPTSLYGRENWRIGLNNLVAVNQYMEDIAENPVYYRNGVVAKGASKRFKAYGT